MKSLQVFVMLMAIVVAIACSAEGTPETAAVEKPTLTEPAVEPAARGDATKAPADGGQSTGVMDQPMDGSSVSAFEKSLQRVEQDAEAKDYKMLSMALEWHLFYDLSAGQDKEKLYRNLDGMTPKQIIEGTKR